MDDKVTCRTPTKGREGATRIPAWKYDLLSNAIRKALGAGEMSLADLKSDVSALLPAEDRARLGSFGWHFTTVRLEMEVRGDVQRDPKARPIRVALNKSSST